MIVPIKVIATLGPEGTCSEKAANHYLIQIEKPGRIRLYSSFEQAVEAVGKREADFAIVPSAYNGLNGLVFSNLGNVKIVDTFVIDTPNLVIAKNRAINVNRVATHPAPSSLVDRLFPEAEKILTRSNSISAIEVVEGRADACLTTIVAAKEYQLNIMKDFGPVPMGWNVFAKYD